MIGSEEWRKAVLIAAMDYEDSSFSMLEPEETGLSRSVYISQAPEYPVFILDDREGRNHYPSEQSHVVLFGEEVGSPDERKWATENLDALRAHCAQEIGTTEFLRRLIKLRWG